MNFDNTLIQLRQKAASKPHLEAKLAELKDQKSKFEGDVISLRVSYCDEQDDVRKLEGKSLASYFYNVIGKLDEKLDQERRESYAAKVKLDAAERELASIELDIAEVQAQLQEARAAEAAFQEELIQKRAELKASGSESANRIFKLEQEITVLAVQKKEIQEAISAGTSARRTVDKILYELDNADGWNTLDLIGGGIISYAAKHEHLDTAQNLVQLLQSELRRFKTELADIQISADLQLSIDGFLRFADLFFDGLFADLAVGEQIIRSQNAVKATNDQICQMLEKLSSMESAAVQKADALKRELDDLTVNA